MFRKNKVQTSQTKLRAVDVGFGRVKAMSEEEQLEFPSVTAEFKPIRFTSGLEKKELKDKLCIEYNNRQLMAGDIVFRQGIALVRMSPDRFVKPEGLSLLLAALLLLSENSTEIINLVTGLPVGDYDRRDAYQEALQGDHEIKLLFPDGEILETYQFTINEVKILPQPAGTFFSQILTQDGRLANRSLAANNVGILDIGYNTLDLARFDRLEFIDGESESFSDLGLFEAHKALSRELKASLGAEIQPAELEQYVRGGTIPFGGTTRSIAKERDEAYEEQAGRIVSRALNVWRKVWQLSQIFVTGGGAESMGDYIVEHFANPQQVEICDNSIFTNVDGFLRYGKRGFRDQ